MRTTYVLSEISRNFEGVEEIPLSVDISHRTRLRLSVTDEGRKCILTAVSALPESEAIAYFLNSANCKYLTVHSAEPIPFALAYIVDSDGRLIDDCLLEQIEDECLMLEEFFTRHKFYPNKYYLVRATEMKGVRTVHSVTPIEKERTFECVPA